MQGRQTLACCLLLAGCSSPPQPPTVDESLKRPANQQAAIELQVCRHELHNTRLQVAEGGRRAEMLSASLASAARQTPAPPASPPEPTAPQANGVYTVRFDFGSARVQIPADVAAALVEEARASPLVMLRGRTDGTVESMAEGRIARERANAVRDFLVAAGVDPARIRGTWQPVGDHVADNTGTSGQALNRRVEIELYRVLPVAMTAPPATLP